MIRKVRWNMNIIAYCCISWKLNFMYGFGHGLVQLNSSRVCLMKWIMTAIAMQLWLIFEFLMKNECCEPKYTPFNIRYRRCRHIQVVNACDTGISDKETTPFHMPFGWAKCVWIPIFIAWCWRLRITRKEAIQIYK